MSEKSKTTIMLKSESTKGNAKAKAILSIFTIAESMRATGGDSERKRLQTTAQVLRENGNEAMAKEFEDKASKLPETTRGVSWQDAMKSMEPHLRVIGKVFDDVVKNGATALGTKVAYGLGIEVGTFEKKETKKTEKVPGPENIASGATKAQPQPQAHK